MRWERHVWTESQTRDRSDRQGQGHRRAEITGALEEAMRQAARKRFGQDKEIEARYNDEIGEVELFEFREVVEKISDPDTQILIGEAQRDYDPDVEVGDEIGVKLDTSDFGRILAQAAKQVIIQRIRDAERDNTFDEYSDRQGEVVNGIVRRFEKGAIIVDLGRAEAVIPRKEQVPRESYRPGDRVRAYVIEVNKVAKGPQIILTRTSIEFWSSSSSRKCRRCTRRSFRSSPRRASPVAGRRSPSSLATATSIPVGACVGMKGSRVQAVVQELRGERIDIVPWSPDAARYVCSALAPAAGFQGDHRRDAEVDGRDRPDDQLSLAIGRRGQNVRLAVQLTGWKIDIKSESTMREIAEWLSKAVSVVEGCGDPEADLLLQQGVMSLEDLADCAPEVLTQLPGIDEAGAQSIKTKATELVSVKKTADEEKAQQDVEDEERQRAEAKANAAAAAAARASAAEDASDKPASDEQGDPPADPAADSQE